MVWGWEFRKESHVIWCFRRLTRKVRPQRCGQVLRALWGLDVSTLYTARFGDSEPRFNLAGAASPPSDGETLCLISRLCSRPLGLFCLDKQQLRKGRIFLFSSLILRSCRPNWEGWVTSGGTSRGQSKRSCPCLSPAETGLQPQAFIPGWAQAFGALIDKVLQRSPCASSREAFQSKMCANSSGSTLRPHFPKCATD